MEHTRGDPFELTYSLTENNIALDDLSSLTKAIFVIKTNKTDDDDESLIFLDSTVDVSDLVIDASASTATVSIDSDDMDLIPLGRYYYALELQWPGSRRIEIRPYINRKLDSGVLEIVQDTIRGITT